MQKDNNIHPGESSKKKKKKFPYWKVTNQMSPRPSFRPRGQYQPRSNTPRFPPPQQAAVTEEPYDDNTSNNSTITSSDTSGGRDTGDQFTDKQEKPKVCIRFQRSIRQHMSWMETQQTNSDLQNVNDEENFASDDFQLSNREDFEKNDILEDCEQDATNADDCVELNQEDNVEAEDNGQAENVQNEVTLVPSGIRIPLQSNQQQKTQESIHPSIHQNIEDNDQNPIEIKDTSNSSNTVNVTTAAKPLEMRLLARPQQNVNLNMAKEHNPRPASIAYPKGIPKTFLMQQQKLGAIEPRTNFEPNTPRVPNWMLTPKGDTSNIPTLGQNAPPIHNENVTGFAANTPLFVTSDLPNTDIIPQAYSPSDIYAESESQDSHESSESPDLCRRGQKRLSAFQRLGPLTQPKTPKLTINLLFNKEQAVREVVDETQKEEDKYTPVHLMPDIESSTDETVMKYLIFWPWKKNVTLRKSVTVRPSRSVMLMEQEQMEEIYSKDNIFIQVSVKGYPRSWTKEDVLDTILDSVKGKTFIPCFIEFTVQECRFLVIRNRSALIAIHKLGFYIRKDDVELVITISKTSLTLKHLEFIPKLVLKRRLALAYDGKNSLNLSEFTLKNDLSHFIYYPLNRETNQIDFTQLLSTFSWECITELDLSNNRLTSLEGFHLPTTVPKLKRLNISNNRIERMTALMKFRELSLCSIDVEGNPLCSDYTDPTLYIKVLKIIFPTLTEIDGISFTVKDQFPASKRNYCPEEAVPVVEKFLEVYFPLLDSAPEERSLMEELYSEDAALTITYRQKIRYFRSLFLRSRSLETGELDVVQGSAVITNHICKWPPMEHDPFTFTVDVLYHNDETTIVRLSGILKLTTESLAKDEYLLTFNRSVVLHTNNGYQYKIMNELVSWDTPTEEYANTAFQINKIKSKQLTVKLDINPDKYLKGKLINIFMELTGLERKLTERYLEKKNWNLSDAIEYFMELLKLNSLDSLKPIESENSSL